MDDVMHDDTPAAFQVVERSSQAMALPWTVVVNDKNWCKWFSELKTFKWGNKSQIEVNQKSNRAYWNCTEGVPITANMQSAVWARWIAECFFIRDWSTAVRQSCGGFFFLAFYWWYFQMWKLLWLYSVRVSLSLYCGYTINRFAEILRMNEP